jgi:tRNA (cytidine/uridine-2'-O-)-methyltransferase
VFHIVVFEPEIPPNTGNLIRLAANTGCQLHLIKPLGFSLDDSHLKRAGLDYWREVDVRVWESLADLRADAADGAPWYFMTTKATRILWDVEYPKECYVVFGPESRGLPESLLREHEKTCLRIPMQGTRSLNLSTAVGIALYEALRQQRSGSAGGDAA